MIFFHRNLERRPGSFRKLCLADCFESAGEDRIHHELSRNSSLASITRKRKYTAVESEHVLQRNSRQKYLKKINRKSVASAMATACCLSNCIGGLCTDDVLECRTWFHLDGDLATTELAKDQLLGEVLSTRTGEKKSLYDIPRTRFKGICAEGMKKVLGISRWKWDSCQHPERRGRDTFIPRSSAGRSIKAELIFKFLTRIRKTFAENLPNEKNYDLPSNFTVNELLRMLRVDFPLMNFGKDYFLKVWEVHTTELCKCFVMQLFSLFQKYHPDLKIPAFSKFSRCNICFKTNTKRRKFDNEAEKGNVYSSDSVGG